jgi:hypothetical protein
VNTVPHIAVVLHVEDDPELEKQVVLWTEACRKQLLEHVAPAWADWADAPGVFYYGVSQHIPSDAAAVVGIYGDGFNPDAAGYHAAIGRQVIGVVDLGRSSKPSRTLSHEITEIYGNAYLDRWLPGPVAGRAYAAELCDPCQRQDYQIDVNVMGEHASVTVGDFVMPMWFGLSPGRTYHGLTWCNAVRTPFEIAPGGYQIALEGDNILYLPARNEGVARASIERPLSRTRLISTGVKVQHEEAQP